MERHAGIAWVRRNAIALLALFVALGGTSYAAATAINGKLIKNGTIPGKKLKRDSVGGVQVNESTLGVVPSATRADSAVVADSAKSATTATNATNAMNTETAKTAQTAETLGAFGPDSFARASQIQVRGPFETDPDTGTDQTFFSFPEIDFTVMTPRPPNKPGIPGLVAIVHNDPTKPLLVHFHNSEFDVVEPSVTGGAINYRVNHDGAEEYEDFLDITIFSQASDLVIWIECVADDNLADMPVTCVASKSRP